MLGLTSWLKILFYYVSVLMPISHCLFYCSFVVSFEIGKCDSPKHSQYCWLLGASCHFIWLGVSDFPCCKKRCWNFHRHCIESVDCFEGYWYLNNTQYFYPWSQNIFCQFLLIKRKTSLGKPVKKISVTNYTILCSCPLT